MDPRRREKDRGREAQEAQWRAGHRAAHRRSVPLGPWTLEEEQSVARSIRQRTVAGALSHQLPPFPAHGPARVLLTPPLCQAAPA